MAPITVDMDHIYLLECVRKFSDSLLTFRCEVLVINFLVAHAVHTKFEDLGKLPAVTLCPIEPSIIVLIVPTPG
jgi:hypothetical protein